MAMFTTEVRRIVETYMDKSAGTIPDRINSALPYIFDDSWTTEDSDYKNILEFNIIRHFYTREIGLETVTQWKLKLNDTLALIMPKYNILYRAIIKVKDNPLGNTDSTETNTQTGNSTSSSDSLSESNGSSSSKQKTVAASNTSSKTESLTDNWQTSNDTPQGGLNGIEENRYLSSAVHNKGKGDQTSTSGGSTDSTSKSKGESSTTQKNNVTGEAHTTSEYTRKIIGKNGGSDNIDTYKKLYTELLNIDKMIMDELEPLFMGLWE